MAEADKPVPTPSEPDGPAPEGPLAAFGPGLEPPVSADSGFDAVLAQARRRLQALAALEVALGAAAGTAAGLLLALFVVGAAPYSLGLRLFLFALLPLGGLVGGGLVVWRRLLPLRHDLVVGARIEEAVRRRGVELGDAVRGAVELRDAASDGTRGRSRALCDAHIEATSRRIAEGGGLDSLPGVALERAVPTLVGAAVVGFIVIAWALAGSSSWQVRWDKLFSDAGAQRALDERAASLLPLVTDLKLTLRFPAYMQEHDEVIPGSSGDVTAPRGTEVIVEGRADRAIERATLLVGEDEIAAEVKDGRTVIGRFVVNQNGTYRFRIDPVGAGLGAGPELDPVAHRITVRPDAAPTVTLEEPAEDRVVKIADEVGLSFSAKDDVGVTSFRVVVKRQGSAREPYVKELMTVPGGVREARGTGKLRIDETGARPGDKLSVYVEALDNDEVNGPKPGRSQTRVLTVYSAAEQHRTVIARLEEVLARMVESLADELEAPVAELGPAGDGALEPQRRALDRHRQIGEHHKVTAKALDDALLALAEDEMAPVPTRRALANMKLKLSRALDARAGSLKAALLLAERGGGVTVPARTRMAADQKVLVERLEHDVIYLEDLLNRERIAEARQIAEDLKRAQQDLKALVDQFKQTGDEDTRKALLDEIQRMRKQMAELMERLAKLQRDVPDEFLNHEAFQGEEMMKSASEIDRLIEEGKLDEAAQALDEMLKNTQQLVEELDKSGEEYGGDEYKELREKMERFSDELEALQKGQDQVLGGSQAAMDKARRAAEQRLKGKLDKAIADVKKKVERAEKKLAGLDPDALFLNESEDAQFSRARIDDLKRALESGDLDDAVGAAEEAEAAARSAERSVAERSRGRFGQRDRQTLEQKAALEEARSELEAARQQLQQLVPDPSELLEKGDRQRLARDADRQEQLRENADRLSQLMDEIGKDAPIFGPEHKKRLEDAKQSMQRAGREMRAQNLRGARTAQRQALRQLSELGKDLQEMAKGQGAPGGMPMPLPRGGSPGGEDGEGESRRASREEVKIPDGSEFKVPDAYRKDILDAMREGVPESWAGEVKRYYEKLIK
jgi:hypothetical protein